MRTDPFDDMYDDTHQEGRASWDEDVDDVDYDSMDDEESY